MSDNKRILRLYFEGNSQRQIAGMMKVSRDRTVAPAIKAAEKLKLTMEKIADLSEDELTSLLFPDKKYIPEYVQPDYEYCHKELLKDGVTLSLLYEEYVSQCRDQKLPSYKRTQFFDKYAEYVRKNRLTMHISHKPADRIQVDWDGVTMEVFDEYTGEISTAYLFVGTLPFSMFSYVEACPSMKIHDWINCHIHMFEYFDGVSRLLIPDNLKTGVISNRKYEDPVTNKAYQEMADHYDITIIPARVRMPKDKAAVEGAVGNVTNAIIGKLRNRKFFSIESLNKAIRIELDRFNDKPFQKKDGSRRSVYEEEEKPFMKSLPEYPYELSSWKIATVQMNYHIQVDKMNYSVPHEYAGKKVDVKLTKDAINVFYKGTQIASHRRLYGRRNQYSTLEIHMPENHQLYQWNADRFLNWAKSIGPNTYQVIDRHIHRYSVEEQSYKGCISILKLSDKYTALRLENACQLALDHISNPTYKNIRLILEAGQDETQKPEKTKEESADHALVRGSSYYGGKRS
ncbi:MAG: IS21 family transposase [Erysipelotrichaceae bacterium]|nr:IS21 family transposase [Erysipelotrichaceae bacterium]